jgi:hypothetical protein
LPPLPPLPPLNNDDAEDDEEEEEASCSISDALASTHAIRGSKTAKT